MGPVRPLTGRRLLCRASSTLSPRGDLGDPVGVPGPGGERLPRRSIELEQLGSGGPSLGVHHLCGGVLALSIVTLAQEELPSGCSSCHCSRSLCS